MVGIFNIERKNLVALFYLAYFNFGPICQKNNTVAFEPFGFAHLQDQSRIRDDSQVCQAGLIVKLYTPMKKFHYTGIKFCLIVNELFYLNSFECLLCNDASDGLFDICQFDGDLKVHELSALDVYDAAIDDAAIDQ